MTEWLVVKECTVIQKVARNLEDVLHLRAALCQAEVRILGKILFEEADQSSTVKEPFVIRLLSRGRDAFHDPYW